jgi:hypothetical protein
MKLALYVQSNAKHKYIRTPAGCSGPGEFVGTESYW